MLVLTRRVGEKIFIGDDIVVTLVRIKRNEAQLGFEASGNVRIVCEETPAAEDLTRWAMQAIGVDIPLKAPPAACSGP
jgi:carbon storage regulator